MLPRKYPAMTNLKWLRIQACLTQTQLGKAVGLSFTQISHYETGKAKPRDKTLKRLAKVLKVKSEELLE